MTVFAESGRVINLVTEQETSEVLQALREQVTRNKVDFQQEKVQHCRKERNDHLGSREKVVEEVRELHQVDLQERRQEVYLLLSRIEQRLREGGVEGDGTKRDHEEHGNRGGGIKNVEIVYSFS